MQAKGIEQALKSQLQGRLTRDKEVEAIIQDFYQNAVEIGNNANDDKICAEQTTTNKISAEQTTINKISADNEQHSPDQTSRDAPNIDITSADNEQHSGESPKTKPPQIITLEDQLQSLGVEKIPGFQKLTKKEWQCQFCGTTQKEWREAGPCTCDNSCFYCRQCFNMGKVKRCTTLYALADESYANPKREVSVVYRGQLSPAQAELSNQLVEFIRASQQSTCLVWAVTGAGKTEMIFKAIQSVLQAGGRVALAAPRIDVCQELAPRIKEAFPSVDQICLNSVSEDQYRHVPLTILTTHQLLRFYQAFDLLIIDEVDAFPYSNQPMLVYGARRALQQTGKLVYLTATPSKALQKSAQKSEIESLILPARYHRHPLVVPKAIWCGDWRKAIAKQALPKSIKKWLQQHLDDKKRFLLFVPSISIMPQVEKSLIQAFPAASFTLVSSKEVKRAERVLKMRQEEYDFLVTTTILERGVTFPNIDVLVLGAEDQIFTKEVLIQIAGRAGRTIDFPTGEVLFAHYGTTKAIKQAIKEIKSLNQLALAKGMIDYE